MGFLRRLLGGDAPDPVPEVPADPAEFDALEREHERDLRTGEEERLDDLQRRQLRYAEYAWEPPAQGGERRAEDTDGSTRD